MKFINYIRIFLFILIVIGIGLLVTQKMWVPKLVDKIIAWQDVTIPESADYQNATYIIDGQPVSLINGEAESIIAPGSASKVVTKYFGNIAEGDLNGDGLADVAFILTQNKGGSGIFYYAVVSLKTRNGYRGINAIFLGDRISPQTTEIREGRVIVNYADRTQGQSMVTPPSIGVSKYLQVLNGVLVVIK